MVFVESHDRNWEASGCAIRSFFVCFSYDFKAALKMAWKREEAVVVGGVWDMTGLQWKRPSCAEVVRRMVFLQNSKAGMKNVKTRQRV
jgi:hypothetical protein